MKISEWLNIWLEKYIKPYAKQKTIYKYEYLITKHIIPILGNYQLEELSIEILQEYFNHKVTNGNLNNHNSLSASTVIGIHSLLKNAIKMANECEMTKINNLAKVKLPKTIDKEIKVFTKSEQEKIVAFCLNNKRNYLGIIICLYMGIRLGELLALRWSDIDYQAKLLHINKTAFRIKTDGKSQICINEPKTRTSKRLIPIPEFIFNLLNGKHKTNDSNYIISTKSGNMVDSRSYQRTFKTILKKCQIEPRNFHTLRHTFATMALECGMDAKSLSEILGHKSPTITLNRYTHSFLNYKFVMMNKLTDLSI